MKYVKKIDRKYRYQENLAFFRKLSLEHGKRYLENTAKERIGKNS